MNHPPLTPLPIDPLLPDIVGALEKGNAAVVTAQPGAGKTTRVPPALLSAALAKDKEIWVLQPRRVAAKLACLRVAQELGEEPGKRVGYQFRFEKRVGPETRLKFMTDGMLLPLAQNDPKLSKVAAVVLDEFHERSLALELGLGYLRKLQLTSRPDLRLLVMSATLDSQALSSYLSGCPIFNSEGRVFPVSLEYFPFSEQPHLDLKVKSALRQLSAKGLKGTTLVFLPGVPEIRRCEQALKGEGMEVHALYGDLSVEEQQRVLSPTAGNKVILSTNVAETSLTVPGVTTVIDSGLTRQMRVSTWSGLESLVTVPASQASSTQRAGRAGRLSEGACLRLYSKFDFEHRASFDVPELLRSDLSKSVLDLKQLGVEDLGSFPWFLKPAPGALETAEKLLARLGALKDGKLTEEGRRMARFPLPPRLSRFLLKTQELSPKDTGALSSACRLAALISEERAESEDLLEELGRFDPGFESKRLVEQLMGSLREEPSPSPSRGEGRGEGGSKTSVTPHPNPLPQGARGKNQPSDTLLSKALLCAFPDRVAKVRSEDTSATRNRSGKIRELLLSGGGSAIAGDNPLTRAHEYFVVVEAQETPGGVKARSLCPIEEDWLLDLFPDELREEQDCEWNSKAQRVEGFKRLKYGQLILDEKPLSPGDFGPEAAALLLKQALSAGPQSYCDPDELSGFLNRVRFVAERVKGSPSPSSFGFAGTQGHLPVSAVGEMGRGEGELAFTFSGEMVQEVLKELCLGCRSLKDLKEAGLVSALRSKLSPKDQALLEKLAPTSLVLPSGRRLTIHYEEGKPPWAESRLQDFFGMTKGPAVGGGEVPVVLHLLSPAKKSVQVTSDLAGFWKNHYPQVRKELSRKYPRHKWPENPLSH